jgi:hypothetical protein
MRFKTTRIVAAIAVIGAVAAGGAAFTASNTVPSSVAGYGSASVTGGTVTSLTYGLSTDGSDIDTATVVWTGDTSADSTVIGFNGDATQDCASGTYDIGSGDTTFVCTLSGITTSDETSADIALTGPSTS